jgi:hypothetical protein
VIFAPWLGRGKSITNDCAGLMPDIATHIRPQTIPCKARRIIGERLLVVFRQNAEFGVDLDADIRSAFWRRSLDVLKGGR